MDSTDDEYTRARVEQATAMIAAQLDCSIEEAHERLRIRAAADRQTMVHTALDVLDGIIRFEK